MGVHCAPGLECGLTSGLAPPPDLVAGTCPTPTVFPARPPYPGAMDYLQPGKATVGFFCLVGFLFLLFFGKTKVFVSQRR